MPSAPRIRPLALLAKLAADSRASSRITAPWRSDTSQATTPRTPTSESPLATRSLVPCAFDEWKTETTVVVPEVSPSSADGGREGLEIVGLELGLDGLEERLLGREASALARGARAARGEYGRCWALTKPGKR